MKATRSGRKVARVMIAALLASLLLAGCDSPPSPPRRAKSLRRVKVLAVSSAERDELKLATNVETARVNYRYRLKVLEGYYQKVGQMDKLIWARKELKNLDRAQAFSWVGLPAINPPKGESLEGADERALVEYVVAARKKYTAAVAELADYYRAARRNRKARQIANMQDRFDPIRTYMYFLSAEIPPADLKCVAVIPEADGLFAKALKLHRAGKGIFHTALTTSYHKQRRALLKFLELVEKHPSSNKAPASAYYIAEIYKEYFNENIRAVQWYQRARQWDPNLPKPAYFQAATVHDLRLHNYAEARRCYRLAAKHEQFNASNVRFAHKRIRELIGK